MVLNISWASFSLSPCRSGTVTGGIGVGGTAVGTGVAVGSGVALGATDGTTVGGPLGAGAVVGRLAAVGSVGGTTVGAAAISCALVAGGACPGTSAPFAVAGVVAVELVSAGFR